VTAGISFEVEEQIVAPGKPRRQVVIAFIVATDPDLETVPRPEPPREKAPDAAPA
jgi:hypothetical protein